MNIINLKKNIWTLEAETRVGKTVKKRKKKSRRMSSSSFYAYKNSMYSVHCTVSSQQITTFQSVGV